ncbi:MAG: hypothetical protein F4Y07_13610 [Gemmatimonadetes bacterium]|nr:hypothetical protein [Gemmatimonadota bacterium]MYB08080.1 hypothetical protein [Gemmatimonadota bacterium]MYE17507.1 hypothetical protein [Gemmatimonadota bacterium]MYJ39959.1 hypothetical protein [Gemmatimonadota bacterium]
MSCSAWSLKGSGTRSASGVSFSWPPPSCWARRSSPFWAPSGRWRRAARAGRSWSTPCGCGRPSPTP